MFYPPSEIDHPDYYAEPNIKIIDDFLSHEELIKYQNFLSGDWTLGPTIENFKYLSRDLYNHYQWNNDWSDVRWLDDVPCEWEQLYDQIAVHLPPHRIHWVDLKITSPLSTGTPMHRDKDPWRNANDSTKFSKAWTVICNLNSQWHPSWGGALIAHQAVKRHDGTTSYIEKQRIPITPGQLIVGENFYHSIQPVTEPERHRISLIVHVLQYK